MTPRNRLLAAFGLALLSAAIFGPRGLLGARSVIVAPDIGVVTFFSEPGGEAAPLRIPSMRDVPVPTRMTVLDRRSKREQTFYRVRFRVTERMALKSIDGRLKPGDVIEGWIAAWSVPTPRTEVGDMLLRVTEPLADLFSALLRILLALTALVSFASIMSTAQRRSRLGMIALRGGACYVLMTFAAVAVGLIVVNLIRPGEQVSLLERDGMTDLHRAMAASLASEAASAATTSQWIVNLLRMQFGEGLDSALLMMGVLFGLLLGFGSWLCQKQSARSC